MTKTNIQAPVLLQPLALLVMLGYINLAAASQSEILDPNMPTVSGIYKDVEWHEPGLEQEIVLHLPNLVTSVGYYLGFNERGTWILNRDDGRIYLWNLQSKSLLETEASMNKVPRDLSNPSVFMNFYLEFPPSNQADHSSTRREKAQSGIDPNMPMRVAPGEYVPLGISWRYPSNRESVQMTTPSVGIHVSQQGIRGEYLGFDGRGSWIASSIDGRIYVWNIETLTLTYAAPNISGVPTDLLNASSFMGSHLRAGELHSLNDR